MNVQHVTKARRGRVYPVLCTMKLGSRMSCLIKKRNQWGANRISRDHVVYVAEGFDIIEWNNKYHNTTIYDWVVLDTYGWQLAIEDNEEGMKHMPTMEAYL